MVVAAVGDIADDCQEQQGDETVDAHLMTTEGVGLLVVKLLDLTDDSGLFDGVNLVAHLGETYLVNNHYEGNGIDTSINLKGYKDLAAAQAAAATSGALHGKLTRLLKTIGIKYPRKDFAQMLLAATEVLHEDEKIFRLLTRIEECGDEQIKSLVMEAKIELKEKLKGYWV